MHLVPFNHEKFFAFLQTDLGDNINLANWLEDILPASRAGIYRRMKGKIQLTVSELLTIAKHSPKTAQRATDLFKAHPLKLFHLHPQQCLESIELQMIQLEQLLLTASGHDDFQWDYSARDLPLFFFFRHPEMLTYKLSMWTNSLSNRKELKLSDSLFKKAKELWNLYRFLPTTELWNVNAFRDQEQAIIYHNEMNCLSDQEASSLLKCLNELKAEFKLSAKQGKKRLEGNIEVFSNASFTLNNGSRIHFDGTTQLFGTLHDIQYYQSSSPEVLELFDASWQEHMALAKAYRGEEAIENGRLTLLPLD